jgi:mannan endo-1,4-beta-mannosidase
MVRRRTALVAALLTVLAINLAVAAPASGAGRQLALGISMKHDRSPSTYESFSAIVGRQPATWSIWTTWAGKNKRWPRDMVNYLKHTSTVPLIVWQPMDPEVQNRPTMSLRKILDNKAKWGKYVRTFARAARNSRQTIILRFAHEMDCPYFTYGQGRFDNTPKMIRDLWHWVWQQFQKVGATNVKFLWSPNNPGPGCTPWPRIYPGDRYVDYVGMSGFNWGIPNDRSRPWSRWKPMATVLEKGVEGLMALTRKPIVVAETGSSPDAPRGKSKANWIRYGYPDIYRRYPRVVLIAYFNVDMRPAPDRHEDWRLADPGGAPRNQYKSILALRRFQGVLR